MGLDMYLTGVRFIWTYKEDELALSKEISKLVGAGDRKTQYVHIEVAYWRKANGIHHWFVTNVQKGEDNCQESWVSRDKLRELLDICKKVKEYNSLASVLLPTQSGFFFGSTDYDEYYFSDLEGTIDKLESALQLPDCWEFYYRASW